MKKLEISSTLSLPIDGVTQKLAMLGRTGSGKSYAATKLAEEMLDAGAQIVALDPVGIWYGLRTAYSIPVFGGLHGDVPLEVGGGALIADLIVDRRISAVVDVSQFESDADKARFARDFAARFYFRQKQKPSPVHLFLEEAQEFVPQNPEREEGRMLHAFVRIAKLGRNFGIGATLLSQRPQEVNKKALNQTECLFAFQMTGPQERDTIAKWATSKGVDENLDEILPSLEVGQAHVWSPQWLRISQTVKVAKKKTADVSSTPKHGAKPIRAKDLQPVDLEALREKMAATIERSKSDDPKELRVTIGKLQREKAELEKKVAKIPDAKIEEKKVEVPILKAKEARTIEKAAEIIAKQGERATAAAAELVSIIKRAVPEEGKLVFESGTAPARQPFPRSKVAIERDMTALHAPAAPAPAAKPAPAPVQAGEQSGDCALNKKVERALLTVFAQHPRGLTKKQALLFAGYRSSGDTNTAFRKFVVCGFVDDQRDFLIITGAGLRALGSFTPLPKGAELRRQMLGGSRLKKVEQELLRVFFDAYPDAVSKNEALARSNYRSSGDTNTAFRKFVVTGWTVPAGNKEFKAADELFEE